jgi:hypothetical protein
MVGKDYLALRDLDTAKRLYISSATKTNWLDMQPYRARRYEKEPRLNLFLQMRSSSSPNVRRVS